MILTIKWCGQRPGFATFPSCTAPKLNPRIRNGVINPSKVVTNNTESDTASRRRANLSASRKEKIQLPSYNFDSSSFNGFHNNHISEFLNHPAGTESILNKKALQSFQFLDSNTYRCTMWNIELLDFKAAPTMDLRVTSTKEDCLVEMLSCKFEGSKEVELQNDHFSAFMTSHITWGTDNSSPFLEVDAKLNISLEVYTLPFTALPIAAVEHPGNFMIQALLDRYVPLLLQQLVKDYTKWVHQRVKEENGQDQPTENSLPDLTDINY